MPKKKAVKKSSKKSVSLGSPIELLTDTIKLYRENLALYAGYAAWLLVPFIGVVILSFFNRESTPILVSLLALTAAQIILWIWVSIVIIKLTDGLAGKKKMHGPHLAQESFEVIVPVAIAVFLQTVLLVGGLFLLIIPGLVFFVWFAFVQPAVVLDGKTPTEALSYSRGLVRGHFWQTLLQLITGPVIILLAYTALLALVTFIGLSANLVELPMGSLAEYSAEPPIWLSAFEALGDTFIITPLFLIYSTLLYRKLKKK